MAAELDIHQVKARYIHSFIKYVTWPATNAAQTFAVGVVDASPLKQALDEVLRAKEWQGKPLQAVTLDLAEKAAASSVAVVYVRENERDRISELLRGIPKNVLTIGEGPYFAAKGGMIEFNLSEGRVRFSVNLQALRQAGFSVESKLLTAAQEVRK